MINTLTLLPPDIFPPEMQPIIYFTLLPTIIIIMAIIFVVIYLYAPKVSKMYFFNKLKKLPIVDYETDDGRRGQETVTPYTEGVAFGNTTKTPYLFPRPLSNKLILYKLTPELEETKQKMLKEGKTEEQITKKLEEIITEEIKDAREMERVVLRPSIDKDIGVPIYRAYLSRVNATTLAHIVGLENTGKSKSSIIAVPIVKKTGKRLEPVELNIGKDKKTDSWAMPVALPVDPKVIKKWFSLMWNPSQLTASNLVSEQIGLKNAEGFWKKFMIIICVMVGILLIGIVAMMMGQG